VKGELSDVAKFLFLAAKRRGFGAMLEKSPVVAVFLFAISPLLNKRFLDIR
jgi:hypothetical protein